MFAYVKQRLLHHNSCVCPFIDNVYYPISAREFLQYVYYFPLCLQFPFQVNLITFVSLLNFFCLGALSRKRAHLI